MSLYNIQSDSIFNIPKATWNTNNSRNSIKVLQHYNASSTTAPTENLLTNDRYVMQSKLLSSTKQDRKNQDTIKTYLETLPITITQTPQAIRNGFYNKFSNSFDGIYPVTFKYYIPQQNISSIHAQQAAQYKNNTKISGINYDLFLPENYQDQFNSKKTILTNIVNTITEFENLFIVENNELIGFFIQTDPEDNLSYNSETVGVAYTQKTKKQFVDEVPYVLNIIKNDKIIVSLVYNPKLVDTTVVIKHPLINNSLLIILQPQDQNFILE
jgi:hypothetical protein